MMKIDQKCYSSNQHQHSLKDFDHLYYRQVSDQLKYLRTRLTAI